ncbi:MAG: TonB-dependent receptor [Sinimarinibacterium sp.]
MRSRTALLAAALGGCAACWAVCGWAQDGEADAAPPAEAELTTIAVADPAPADAPARPADEDGPTVLDQIEVTAERRVSTVQETPISMDAFNEHKLALRGIQGIQDLASNVPSLVIEPFPIHNATLRLSIRGVGVTDAQVTQDPAVGIYLDGVYIARSVGLALDLADLERIEVLRGPQGTLYGRNTTGGAINLVTRRPSVDLFSMTHQITLGSRDQLVGKSSLNLPLGDDFAVKLALLGGRRDGFVENTGPGGDFGDREETALRFDARWLATDWLTADYAFDRSDLEYYNYMFQAILPPLTSHGQADLFKPYAQTQTVYSQQRLSSLNSGSPMEASGSHVRGHTLTLTAPLHGYELKYIGAFRELTDDQYANLGGGAGSLEYRLDQHAYDGPAASMANGGPTAGPTPVGIPQVFQEQWSHEVQVSGSLFDERLSFIAGAYTFSERGGENGGPVYHILNTLLDPDQASDLFDAVPGMRELLRNTALPRLVAFWDYDLAIDNSADALFGQLTWTPDFLDRRLSLTGGLRYSHDERSALKTFEQSQYVEGRAADQSAIAVPIPAQVLALQGNDVFAGVRGESSYTDIAPSVNLQYQVATDAIAYVSYASAYKSGGFNVRDPQISGESGPASDGQDYGFGFIEGFKPEQVKSLEFGVKSEWFHRSLRLNVSVFDTDYRDMQTNFLIAGTISDTKSRNAGKAKIRGVEVDAAVVPARGLILALQYAFLDAEVLEVIDVEGNNVAALYPFIAAPPHSYVGSVDWTFLEGGWGALRAYVNYNYVGNRQGFVITEARRGLTATEGYGLFNARLAASGWRVDEHGSVDIGLWGKNLADEEYPATAIDNLPQADRAVIWGEPRAYGLDLIYRYF